MSRIGQVCCPLLLRGLDSSAYTCPMDTTIRLTPHSQELLKEQLAHGSFRSPEEVIEMALETLAQKESAPRGGSSPRNAAEAVADILEIQKRNRLGGLTFDGSRVDASMREAYTGFGDK